MRIRVKAWPWLVALGMVLLAACDGPAGGSVVQETEEKHYQRGQRLLREGRESEALGAFLKVIEKRPDAAESHLEVGILYQEHVGDPIASIYHLRRYLELEPTSREASKVAQMIETAKKDFARQLPGQPYDAAIDRLDLLEMLEDVRKENEALKQQLATYRTAQSARAPTRSSPPARVSAPAMAERPAAATPTLAPSSSARAYTVESGDTLSRISSKVYGDPARWQDIFEANRDQLPSPHALKVGQSLRIPE